MTPNTDRPTPRDFIAAGYGQPVTTYAARELLRITDVEGETTMEYVHSLIADRLPGIEAAARDEGRQEAVRLQAVLWQLMNAVERHLETNHGHRHTEQAGPSMGQSIRLLRQAMEVAKEAMDLPPKRKGSARVARHGRSSDPEPAPPADARSVVQHALDSLNEASDLAMWGDATESSLLEAHATLATLLDRWAVPALQAAGEPPDDVQRLAKALRSSAEKREWSTEPYAFDQLAEFIIEEYENG